jgi:hypothetical protein
MDLLCDPLAAVDLYALEHDEQGGCHLADRHLVVPVCIYVAVDDAASAILSAASWRELSAPAADRTAFCTASMTDQRFESWAEVYR